MSSKSSPPGEVVSLPEGGGALGGLGEKFSPDLHTGTGNFTVPIILPPGRNGFHPQLRLVYSTGNGNGPFGLGWSVSIPGVSRKTSKGVPRYDARDVFILSEAEDLVPVEELATETHYRPRAEGLFARIVHRQDADSDHDYWQVRSRDGLVSLFGTPGAAGDDPAVVADPARRNRVFAWKLTQTIDPFGNRIEYEYLRDTGEAGPHHWDQLYLSEVRYADYGDPANPQFLATVRFVYEERPDPFSDHRAGFEVRTHRRCVRIEVATHPGEDRPTRTYHLVYLDQRGLPPESLPHNGVSLLTQIRVQGHDGTLSETLPPLEFGYSRLEPERRQLRAISGPDLPPGSLAHPDYELADLFGNGLPDVVEMNATVRYWRNLGNGRFDLPRQMRDAPAGLRLADPGVQLVDADGDGRIDLLVTAEGLSGYYPLQFGGLWDQRSFQRFQVAPSVNLQDPEVRLVDLDGDGVTDAIHSGARLECFFNRPEQGGWNDVRWVERRPSAEFPDVSFSDPRVRWSDMTGDGLQDIVLVYDGNVEYWPSLGHGDWGKRVSMRRCPRFPAGYDPRRILVGDVDGDGMADIVYVEDRKVTVWINQSGNAWSEPVTIRGTPPVSDPDTVRLADMLGTGVSGVLWSAPATEVPRDRAFFLDLTGGVKPYLLNEMDNHMGATTRVEYAPSTRFYLEDQRRPATRWRMPLPFPVQVVAQVEVIDALSGGKLTTEYSYHHGYWDGVEREFRGFGRVEQQDSEVFERHDRPGLHGDATPFARLQDRTRFSPPTLTKTWFHQGPVGEALGDWDETDFGDEFWPERWPGDPGPPQPSVLSRPAAITSLLEQLPRRVRRDALRTLRGSILRSELYALDDGPDGARRERPYTVTEYLYGLREEAAPDPNDGDRLRVFFPHLLAERATQWERGDDPMTRFTFTDDYDAYGQPRSRIDIAVPQGRDFRTAATLSEPYLATQTLTTRAQRDDQDRYLVDRVARTTTFELENDGRSSLPTLRQRIRDEIADGQVVLGRRIIGQTLAFYDGPAFQGRPFGELGDYGALVRTEDLVLTEQVLHDAYRGGDAVLEPPEEPPYLASSGVPTWTPEYPQAFRALLPTGQPSDPTRPGLTITPVGYGFADGTGSSPYARGYFAATQRRYDLHDPNSEGRGLVTVRRDPLGRDTTIAYEAPYQLLQQEVTDAVGLTTTVSYDYRVHQPTDVTDPNGNRTRYTFTPLGLLNEIWVSGKPGRGEGDQTRPATRFTYDFLAFADRSQPVSVRTIRQLHHDSETDIPLPERAATVETVQYSDGFGRLLQTRAQGEDVRFGDAAFGGGESVLPRDQADVQGVRNDVAGRGSVDPASPNVVVSGWQTYDNKGRVVERYEPFLSTGWAYRPPEEAQLGAKTTRLYDPRGRLIGTINPDGSQQRVIHGVPADLASPDEFTPTPWEAYTYDENDNAGRTSAASPAAAAYRHHWDTPASVVVDPLGRTVLTVARNRAKPGNPADPPPPIEEHRTVSAYDIRGNLVAVTDALGREAIRHWYDLANRPLRSEGIDAGGRRTILDAGGNTVERRDSKGTLLLRAYDAANRPIRTWARDTGGEPLTLRERLAYGEDGATALTSAQATAANLLGRLYRQYDEAGLLTFASYDFKGNVLSKTRQVIADSAILAVFDPPPPSWKIDAFRVDWATATAATLGAAYTTTIDYDALNRVKAMRYPADVTGGHRTLRPRYNRAGRLERVQLDGATYVERIAYDARGKRVLIAYANGVMTRYAYHPETFRLARLRSERYSVPAGSPNTYRPTAPANPLQDLAYEHDLAGNVMTIKDRAPGSGIPTAPLGADELDRAFTYDPLYRLLSATGRECDGVVPPQAYPWDDRYRCADPTLIRGYTQRYRYDAAGNLSELQHVVTGGGFTRTFGLVAGSNRLSHMTVGGRSSAYQHDANGNLVRENTERHFEWDHADRMRVFRTQPAAAEPSEHVHHLYDADGRRVMKLVRKQGGAYEVAVFIDGVLEHYRWGQATGPPRQSNRLHIIDDQSRIAVQRVGDREDQRPDLQYHLGDHLGSSNLVLDQNGDLVDREEYFPYGETSFGSFAKKRYRFTGKERDEESGLYYHGARYYAPWLGRWMSCDPAGMVDGINLYCFCRSNPTRYSDRTGTQAKTREASADSLSVRPDQPAGRELPTRPMGEQSVSKPEPHGKSPTVHAAPESPMTHEAFIRHFRLYSPEFETHGRSDPEQLRYYWLVEPTEPGDVYTPEGEHYTYRKGYWYRVLPGQDMPEVSPPPPSHEERIREQARPVDEEEARVGPGPAFPEEAKPRSVADFLIGVLAIAAFFAGFFFVGTLLLGADFRTAALKGLEGAVAGAGVATIFSLLHVLKARTSTGATRRNAEDAVVASH